MALKVISVNFLVNESYGEESYKATDVKEVNDLLNQGYHIKDTIHTVLNHPSNSQFNVIFILQKDSPARF